MKRKNIKTGVKLIVFILIAVCIYAVLARVLIKKYKYSENSAATDIAKGYYEEPDYSLDVLYLGTSYMKNAISPLTIWNNYGYTGYSRASSQQPAIASKYLLKETIKNQNLKAVVFEVSFLIETEEENEVNYYERKESKIHEVLDYMNWSSIKWDFANEVAENSTISILDLLSPLYRYHDRWEELNENDFSYSLDSTSYSYKGAYPSLAVSSYTLRSDYMKEGDVIEVSALNEIEKEQISQIIEICKENGIQLIFIKTPSVAWDYNKHCIIEQYAEENDIPFLDYCMEDLMNETEFDIKEDSVDRGLHLNLWGAEKISLHLGKILGSLCSLEDKRSEEAYQEWNSAYLDYQQEKKAGELVKITGFSDYLSAILDDSYTVIITTKGTTSLYYNEELQEKMNLLGLKTDFINNNGCYIAIISKGEVIYEEQGNDYLEYEGRIGKNYWYAMSKYDRRSYSETSVLLNEEEVSLNENGFNIIVYDEHLNRIISTRNYNTGNGGKIQ